MDGTIQNTTLTMPSEPCSGCTLRLQREVRASPGAPVPLCRFAAISQNSCLSAVSRKHTRAGRLQAKEWGGSYLFKSCAMVDVVPAATAGACNGCSGRGTCGGNGVCTCESTAAGGFFYGDNCEYENECEENAHCGQNGRCVEVGDTAGPAKQCFCRAGFFGDVAASATGLERRVCNRATELVLDVNALDTFGEGYERSETTETFEMYWTVTGDAMEVAVKAMTTSWVGVGWRSVECVSRTLSVRVSCASDPV